MRRTIPHFLFFAFIFIVIIAALVLGGATALYNHKHKQSNAYLQTEHFKNKIVVGNNALLKALYPLAGMSVDELNNTDYGKCMLNAYKNLAVKESVEADLDAVYALRFDCIYLLDALEESESGDVLRNVLYMQLNKRSSADIGVYLDVDGFVYDYKGWRDVLFYYTADIALYRQRVNVYNKEHSDGTERLEKYIEAVLNNKNPFYMHEQNLMIAILKLNQKGLIHK